MVIYQMNSPTGTGVIPFDYYIRYRATTVQGPPFLAGVDEGLEKWEKELQRNPDPFARLYQWVEVASSPPSPPSSDSLVIPGPVNKPNPVRKWKAEVRIQEVRIQHQEGIDLFPQSAQYWEQKYQQNKVLLELLHAHRQINMMAKELESIKNARRVALEGESRSDMALSQMVTDDLGPRRTKKQKGHGSCQHQGSRESSTETTTTTGRGRPECLSYILHPIIATQGGNKGPSGRVTNTGAASSVPDHIDTTRSTTTPGRDGHATHEQCARDRAIRSPSPPSRFISLCWTTSTETTRKRRMSRTEDDGDEGSSR
ncbi:MAG: hypothetical protein M1823_004242 [Watsoniomyces obsoletus]|nr:MAG: hypothetical protein M1823_004242 [Watsoniomyces obsoletus]